MAIQGPLACTSLELMTDDNIICRMEEHHFIIESEDGKKTKEREGKLMEDREDVFLRILFFEVCVWETNKTKWA